jgi:hypothetical protein
MKLPFCTSLVTIGALLSGCGDSTGSSTEPAVQVLVSPSTIAAGGDVTLTITTDHFTLELPAGQPNVTGHGHYQIYLDNATGGNYLALGAAGSMQATIPLATAPTGHTLTVALYANDLSPIIPSVATTVDITAQ